MLVPAQSTWSNLSGGLWSADGNWNPNGVPGPTTNAFLTNSAATSYTATYDSGGSFGNLTIQNPGAGTNTLQLGATGFNPAGDIVIGRNGILDLNNFSALAGGTLTVSNLGKLVVRGAALTNTGDAILNGSLVITNSGTFQAGSAASGVITSTNGTILLGSGGTLAAGVITNTSFITTVGGGAGAAVITGSVANLRTNAVAVATLGTAGVNVSGGANDSSLSLVGPNPFLDNVNSGTIMIGSNGTLNVGGTTAAAATGSFTNRGTIVLGSRQYANGNRISTLNAGTLVNDTNGTLSMPNVTGGGGTNFMNADVLNLGTIALNSSGPLQRSIRSLTNYGGFSLADLGNSVTTIQQGDLLNGSNGTVNAAGTSAETLVIANGGLINRSGGVVGFNRTTLKAAFFVQEGAFHVSNSGVLSTLFAVDGVTKLNFTNNGAILLFAIAIGGDSVGSAGTLSASSLFNNGTVTYEGKLGVSADGLPLSQVTWFDGNLSNAVSGIVNVRSNALAVFDRSLGNLGTINIESNSVFSVGHLGRGVDSPTIPKSVNFTGGLNGWTNDGVVNMTPGAFLAVKSLTNSGTLSGGGSIGPVFFQTITNAGGTLTQYVQNVSLASLVNSGAINPGGTLNVGAITNLSGGSIIGNGVIQSLNVTNFFTGSTVTTNTTNVGATIQNDSGATLLASGGTLVLANGFSANLQAGTIGTTNGGTLRIGDGLTSAVTNAASGILRLQGGALDVGWLVSSGTIQGTGTVRAASATSSGTLAPGFSPGTLAFTNDLTLTGSSVLDLEIAGTNLVDYDRLLVGGAFTQGGTLNISFLSYTPTGGEAFDLFDFSSFAGGFSATNLPSLSGGLVWDFDQFQSQGILGISAAIPEPGAAALLLLAAAGLLVFRRRE